MPIPDVVTVWDKPNCVQCAAVERRLTAAGIPFETRDLTAEENAKHLSYFKGLGYQSAPITEYGDKLVPGNDVDGIIAIIDQYREDWP